MKKKILIIIILFASIISARDFSIGGNFSLGFKNKLLGYGGGFELMSGYKISERIRVRAEGGFYYTEFSNDDPYFSSSTYSLTYIEGVFIYSAFNLASVEPYGGLGIGYYFPHKGIAGHPTRINGLPVTPEENLDNNFGAVLLAGINLSPESFLSVIMEFKYLILKSEFAVSLGNQIIPVDADLNMVMFKIGLIFNL